jgi:membrane protein implicated in regulation of membrane protease activity
MIKTPFGRYVLLQIPGWIIALVVLLELHHRFGLSAWVVGGGVLAWIAKDFALYPFVRTAYESEVKTGVEQLVGSQGVVRTVLDPCGQVQVHGELWRAEIMPDAAPIATGEQVRVIDTRGMTLVVTADSTSSNEQRRLAHTEVPRFGGNQQH